MSSRPRGHSTEDVGDRQGSAEKESCDWGLLGGGVAARTLFPLKEAEGV